MSKLTPDIIRDAAIIDIARSADGDGHTLLARAVVYNDPAQVSDNGQDFYMEAWAPGVFTRSLRMRGQQGKVPLLANHNRMAPPIGGVTRWMDTPTALDFEARIVRSDAGVQMVELIESEVVTGVSVGAREMRPPRIERGVTFRTECALAEVSLTAFAQIPGAKVLATRQHDTLLDPEQQEQEPDPEQPVPTPRVDEARAALDALVAKVGGTSGQE